MHIFSVYFYLIGAEVQAAANEVIDAAKDKAAEVKDEAEKAADVVKETGMSVIICAIQFIIELIVLRRILYRTEQYLFVTNSRDSCFFHQKYPSRRIRVFVAYE